MERKTGKKSSYSNEISALIKVTALREPVHVKESRKKHFIGRLQE